MKYKEREKKEGELINERESTIVMQLRGSYQKRSKLAQAPKGIHLF